MSSSPLTKQVWETDKKHFFHPFVNFKKYRDDGVDLIFEKAEGCYVFDTDGKKYLDAKAGIQSTNIGFGNEEIADAIAEQIKKLSYCCNFTDTSNLPATELAAKLAEIAPGSLNHLFFTTGGSTAVDAAFRLIGFYQNLRGKSSKKHILALNNAYHGSTYITMSLGGKKGDRGSFDYHNEGITHLTCPHYYRYGDGKTEEEFLNFLADELEAKINELGADNVAAFFMEPIQSAGGVIVPVDGYHQRVWDICKKYDLLFLADEVVTGFGRVGHFFASESVFGIQPDIITCAKGLTSSYLPMGAAIVSDEIYDTCLGSEEFCNVGFTYSGHPASAVCALKNIEIMERDGILENVRELGGYMEDQLRSLCDLPMVGEVRGMRFMHSIEFVADKETKQSFPPEMNFAGKVYQGCLDRGLILRCLPPSIVFISPPLIMTKEEIDIAVDVIRTTCLSIDY